MTTFLLPLLLAVFAADVSPSEVQVERQNDSLLISAPVLENDEKYSDCWLKTSDGQKLEAEPLSTNSWRIITPVNSGRVTVVACYDGGCRLIHRDFDVGEASASVSFWWALLAALCAGGIMNLMPCVLPVLMLKLKAFGEASKRLPYIAGVMTSFMVLATCSVFLGTGLSQMGFTEYRVVLFAICSAMGFVLLGLWPMPSFGVSGNVGPFGMGCLTVALGSSCAVPFLAPVMAYTMTCTTLETYLLFAALGGGFCSPFIIPGFKLPLSARHYLSWIDKASAVALFAVGFWLSLSLTGLQFLAGLCFLSAIGLTLLILELKIAGIGKAVIGVFPTACIAAGVMSLALLQHHPVGEQTFPTDGPRVIFVTADWCLNCSAMKPTVQSDEAAELMEANGISEVTYLDYTAQPDNISRFLRSHGVRDVPFVLIENQHGNVTKLSGLWKPSDVIKALNMKQIEN